MKQLGDYLIIKQIGRGPLGHVYLAEHRLMKKQMALKVLPEELSHDRAFVQRIEDELSVVSTFDHPHLVKIHHISYDQGRYFIVSECVVDKMGETTNLGQMMAARGKRLAEADLIALLQQVTSALDYAHQKKNGERSLFHGNLKLNNILVGKGETQPNIMISDFSLSRVIGVGGVLTRTYKAIAEAHGLRSTFHGENEKYLPTIEPAKIAPLHHAFLQNYAFFAPEQKRIESLPNVSYKADIYAFGVLVYYLISGQYPEGAYTKPSKVAREYTQPWDHLVEQCLQQDPSLRPENLTKAMEALLRKEYAHPSSFSQPHEKAVNFQMKSVAAAPLQEALAVGADKPKPVLRTSEVDRPDADAATAMQSDASVKYYVPERLQPKNMEPLYTEMAIMTGGKFWRGSNEDNRDERPRHQVNVHSFAIDIHPVTNDQFVRFLEMMGGEKDANHNDLIRLKESRIKRSGGKIAIESGYAKHPVVGVTWYGAVAYAKWIGKRLPYETEWEIISMGGEENLLYPTGDDIEKSQANFFSSDTTPVMSYAPNSLGIYDVAGNVYEWCHDWYSYNYYEISNQEPDDPTGPLQGVYRVLRGGCWKSLKEDLRSSRRHRNNPGTVNGTYGFRCAADVE